MADWEFLCVAKITNSEALHGLNKETEIVMKKKKMKLEYIDHIMRNNKYELLPINNHGCGKARGSEWSVEMVSNRCDQNIWGRIVDKEWDKQNKTYKTGK